MTDQSPQVYTPAFVAKIGLYAQIATMPDGSLWRLITPEYSTETTEYLTANHYRLFKHQTTGQELWWLTEIVT